MFPSTPAKPSASKSAAKRRIAEPLAIKTAGYLISTISVVLLGLVSWKKASEEPLLMACLLGGMSSSILGMLLRWISYAIEERRKAQGTD